ncbi:uncharacterized protein [Heterodontus francisci]
MVHDAHPPRDPFVVSHPTKTAADFSMVPAVPPPRVPFDVSLTHNPSSSATVADNSESFPKVFPPAGYLPTQPTVGSSVVQSLANTPVNQPSAGTPVVQSSANVPVVQSLAGTPVVQSSANIPMVQSSAGTPVVSSSAPTANQQPSALLVAISNTSTASSSVSSIASDSTPQCHSAEFKVPIQEMGNLVDTERNNDCKVPMQEKMVTFDDSKPTDSSRGPKNRIINSDQNNFGDKNKVNEIFALSTGQAKRETKTDQATAGGPLTCRQVQPQRPAYQSNNDDDYRDVDKPEILMSVVPNTQSETVVAFNSPEGGCSITSGDLQLSECKVDNSRSNGSDSSPPFTSLNPTDMSKQASPLSLGDSNNSGANVSCDFSDKNSIKEQKIQALQGYQNDQVQRSFYDVHNPLNIQLNFDAQKKIIEISEGVRPDREDILNQNVNIEYEPKTMPSQVHHIEIAQSVPAFASTLSVHDRADSEVEFMRNVQANNSTDSISSSDLMLSSSDSGCSFGDGSINADSVNEPSVHAEQDSQNSNLLNNNPQFQPCQLLGVQVPAQLDGTDAFQENALQQNQTIEHGCGPDLIGDQRIHFDCNHEGKFTETELNKKSSIEVNVSKRGDSLHSHDSEMSHGKCNAYPEVENTDLSYDDIKVHVGHIYQEPDYKNEACNARKFEAANLGDVSGCDFRKGSNNALSTEHVSLASKERSQARQPVNPNEDLPQSNYLFVSMTVLVLSVVATCIWKYYHK